MHKIARFRSGMVALAVGAALLTPSVAHATEQTSVSAPDGRLTVRSASLSLTDRDGDGNADTATSGDVVRFLGAITNNTASTQGVTISVALDLPGDRLDVTVSKGVRLAAGQTGQVDFKLLIFRFFPRGTYTTSISASDGVESATASSFVTLN